MTETIADFRASKALPRVIQMERINNFRDYGDLPVRGGGRVRAGRLFRSAHHANATKQDLARLAEMGIATVTDLRHPAEQTQQPNAWLGKLPIAVIEEPAPDGGDVYEAPHVAAFRNSDFSVAAMTELLAAYYQTMPFDPRHVAMFRRYFQGLANTDGAMLIHCAAGKDRTGMLAWLTHHILGVHPDDAMEDYLMSNVAANIAERLPHVKAGMERTYGRTITDEALYGMLTVAPRFIDALREALVERAGSIDGYIADVVEVDAATREAVRAGLVA